MTATALLAELGRRGMELRLNGAALCYRAPRGALTDADRDALAEYKAELIELMHLHNAFAALTPAERARLQREAAEGERLATTVLALVGEDSGTG